jgi:predicted Zn-dependent protease
VTRNAIVIALALAGALACVKNPATGERQLILVPEGQAKALGEQAAAEIVQSIGLVENQEVQQYVANIGKQLAANSERPELGWSFQVLDDASVNAFALPGGFIFVTRGILAHLGSEAQLAGVLGHEIGHVTAKHSVDQMSKATLATAGLGIASVVSEDIAKVSQVGAAGLQVLFLKYGRDDEYQADELGIRYAGRGGYDVREMPKVFEVLDRVGGESRGKLPEWLSTHPSPGNRIERIEQHIAKAGPAGGNVARQEYLRKLDGLVYGEDPRQGYFLGGRFVHPKLGFEITFPDGWKTANTAQAVLAQSPGQDAMMQLAIVKAASPDEALQKFLATEGIQAGQRAASAVPNLPSASSTFQAKTKEGVLGGLVTFVTHEGRTYGILAIAKQEQVAAHMPAFEGTRARFAPLTDPALRQVEPATLVIVEVPRAMTLAELHAAHPTTVPLEEIARINGLEPSARLAPGQLVKTVRGGRQGAAAPVSRARP